MKAKNIKKALQIASSSGVLALLATKVAGAATACEDIAWLPNVFCGVSGVFDVESMVRMALYLIIVAAIIWALWNIIRAGLEWTGAAEDPEKKKKATQRIINSVIGLVIVVASFTILSLVSNWFGGGIATQIGQPCIVDGRAGLARRVEKSKCPSGFTCMEVKQDGSEEEIDCIPK